MSLVTQLFKRWNRYVHSIARGALPIAAVMHDGGCLRRVDGEALQGDNQVRAGDGAAIVEKIRTAAAIAAMTVLACGVSGCSASTPAPADSGRPTISPSAPAPKAESSSPAAGGTVSRGAVASAGTKEACELFNKLVADYGAVPPADSNGYEEVYRKARDAKDTVSGDLRGLFTSLGLLALDRSAAAESGGKPAQASQDAVRDAVFANAGACTAAGVTLRL